MSNSDPCARAGALSVACAALATLSLMALPRAADAQCDDPALTRVAVELAEAVELPDAPAIARQAADQGSDAPAVSAARIPDTQRAHAALLQRARERYGARVVCGEAHREGERLVVFAPDAGHLEDLGDSRYAVRLSDGLGDARVVARSGAGEDWHRTVRSGDVIALPRDLPRPWVLQLVASDRSGPHPVAVRRSGRSSNAEAADDETPIPERVQALRAAWDASALRPNRRLSQVATEHAEAICARPRIGHLDDGADPEERLAEAGLRARHVGETVARAVSRGAAWAATLESPSHRAALLDPRFTDFGVGEAEADGRSCVVVHLAAWPRVVPPR